MSLDSLFLICHLLLTVLQQCVLSVRPYSLSEIYIDSVEGTTCKSHEFATIFGISGYISTHDFSLPTYKPSQKCFLTIEAPAAYTIKMQAVQFNLGYPEYPGNCHGDSLFIFDNKPKDGKIFDSHLDMRGEFCETLPPKDSPKNLAVSSNNSMTLYWHATDAAERFPESQGFRLRWFVSRNLRPGLDACHAGSEFACSDGLSCIPVELACDAERHCADGSDVVKRLQVAAGCENIAADSMFSDLGVAAVAGLAVALVTLTLLTASLLTRCCFHRRKNLQRQSRANPCAPHPLPGTPRPSPIVRAPDHDDDNEAASGQRLSHSPVWQAPPGQQPWQSRGRRPRHNPPPVAPPVGTWRTERLDYSGADDSGSYNYVDGNGPPGSALSARLLHDIV